MRYPKTKRRRWRWKNRRSLLFYLLRHWLLEEVDDESDPRPEPAGVVEHHGCAAEIYCQKATWGQKGYVLRIGRYQVVGRNLQLIEYVTPNDLTDLHEVLDKARRWLKAHPNGRAEGRTNAGFDR